MTRFEIAMRNWLKENGFTSDIAFRDDFAYDRIDDIIYIGTVGYSTIGRWFEQFLYEYGLEYTGIFDPVLALIHEIGHSQTLQNYNDYELTCYKIAKEFIDEPMEDQEGMNKYWLIEDEFVANLWAINYINNNTEAVEELCNIYIKYWNEYVKEEFYHDELDAA